MKMIQHIQNKIYEIRGENIMLDKDLAELYKVPTKSLNLAVKRNIKRFPEDFMFQLTKAELESLRFQIETSKGRGGTRYLPYAFTEQGVAMLSSILNSDLAIIMNIAIMRTFVEIRKQRLPLFDIKKELTVIHQRIGEHDTQLSAIYDAIENLLDDKIIQKKWEERERIGFKK